MKKSIKKIFFWALYDFANTIFAINVISLYFALWVTVDKQAPDIYYSIFLSGSILIASLIAPILGVFSDQIKKRKPFLIVFTYICIIYTAALGLVNSLFFGLMYFAFANIGYQLGSIFYDMLLPQVSEKKNIGRVSGIGVGIGYVGTLVGLSFTRPFVEWGGHKAAFVPTALLFLMAALPCILCIKESGADQDRKDPVVPINIKKILQKILSRLQNLDKDPVLKRFLITFFLATIPINAIIVFMSVYARKVFNFSDTELYILLMLSTVFAILGSFAFGWTTDKIGTRKTLKIILWMWCIMFFLASINPWKQFFWFIGPFAGICLGSTWVSSRTFLVELAPEEELGEIFGVCALIARASSIIGPLVWGIIVFVFEAFGVIKYQIAIFVMFLFMTAGLWVFQGIKRE